MSNDPEKVLATEDTRAPGALRRKNPPVLATRPLRADARPEPELSRYVDPVWDLTPGILEEHSTKTTISFDAFPPHWRESVRAYFWTLINVDSPRPLSAGPAEGGTSLRTISFAKRHLLRFLTWCDGVGVTALSQCTPTKLDSLISDLADTQLDYDQKRSIVTEVRRLWTYRDLCPPALALPVESPWLDERPFDLFGRPPQVTGNRTPRIADATLVPLIAWALRFVEDFAEDIVGSLEEYRKLIRHEYRHRPEVTQVKISDHTRKKRLRIALRDLRALGLGIPGRVLPDGTREIRWQHLARLARGDAIKHAKYDRQVLTRSRLHIDDDAYLTTACVGVLEGEPWHGRFLTWDDVIPLATHLQTACFIIVSYFSGMRPGEALSLVQGCLQHDSARDLWTVSGKYWKEALDEDGNKAVDGVLRENPWVVHSSAAVAVQVLQRLSTDDLLFPKSLRPKPLRGQTGKRPARPGKARTSSQLGTDIKSFIDWVNDYCTERGRDDNIPPDPHGLINGTRFRRTLAWHIVRAPRGLVAGAIQYGHLAKHVTQGYGGTYDSGFPDELAMERWLERIEKVGDLNAYLDGGGHVSGPAAEELRRRTRTASAKFVGQRIPTQRQAERLLRDPNLQVFAGEGMHCVHNRATAMCAPKLLEGDVVVPDIEGCRTACINIARTDGDIRRMDERIHELENDKLAPPIRYRRQQKIAGQLRSTVSAHESSRKR